MNFLSRALLQNFNWSARNFLPFVEMKALLHRSPKSTIVPTLGHMNPLHTVPFYAFKIHFTASSHLCLSLPSHLFPSDFPTKTLYIFLLAHACYMPHPSHVLYFILLISDKSNKSWSSSLCISLHPVTSSLLATHIFLRTLFLHTLSALFSMSHTKIYTHV